MMKRFDCNLGQFRYFFYRVQCCSFLLSLSSLMPPLRGVSNQKPRSIPKSPLHPNGEESYYWLMRKHKFIQHLTIHIISLISQTILGNTNPCEHLLVVLKMHRMIELIFFFSLNFPPDALVTTYTVPFLAPTGFSPSGTIFPARKG